MVGFAFIVFTLTGLLMTTSMSDSFAVKGKNNGSNGCENANPNSRVCEKNPNSSCDVTVSTEDCDGDGLTNSEDLCPFNPVGTLGQTDNDCDGDGLTNSFEDGTGCLDKTKVDTDGDSFSDKLEIDTGSDPCASASTP
ncbi:hypothetical protein NSED_09890 [Candidatus Nitrosopumilus sediminis]|uniref:Thrombospondin type 3 repeat-containing protein n=2 Tax=Candidatus Nitrosopumilus sediminis TaxID=1229909 RepID=K0BE92_9ARCH|nr:hypothetical protein NSED_09890 [Candidatus Nitrosopumilus sediminis]